MSLENTGKTIHKIKTHITRRRRQGRGQRGKELKNSICNSIGHLRSCPPRSIKQANQLKYHRRVSRIIGNTSFEDSPLWKPNDLNCVVCNISVTGKKQLVQHFKNTKHKNNVWKCTPKYCDPCGIYYGFSTEQLWTAHTSSRKHYTNIQKLPVAKQYPSEYGFTN